MTLQMTHLIFTDVNTHICLLYLLILKLVYVQPNINSFNNWMFTSRILKP